MPALALLCGAAGLARRHVRRGRGDRRGADRVALTIVSVGAATWLVGAHHLRDLASEVDSFFTYVSLMLFGGAVAWLLYLALEPLVRKWQPRALVGWTRLMSGSFRDPEVGRDLLAGVAAGTLLALLRAPRPFIPVLLDAPPDTPTLTAFAPLLGMRYTIAGMLSILPGSMQSAMLALFAFVVARLIFRRTSFTVAAAIVLCAVLVAIQLTTQSSAAARSLVVVPTFIVLLTVVVRFGLLATVVTFYVGTVLEAFPLTTYPSLRHFAASSTILLFVLGLGMLGAYAARAGQPFIRFADD